MPPDPGLIREALDGRPQTWLAERAGLNKFNLNRVLRGHKPVTRRLYDRCRRVLPTLPPWPDAAADDAVAETAA